MCFPILFSTEKSKPKKQKYVYKFYKGDFDSLREDLSATEWGELESLPSVNEAVHF